MLAELVDKLVGLGRNAARVEVLEVPGSLGRRHYVRNGESLSIVTRESRPQKTEFLDLADFAAAVKHCPEPEVHVHRGGVYALTDRGDRFDRVSLELEETRRMGALRSLSTGWSGSPKQAMLVLRKEFYGTGVEPVIQALSRIDFKRTSSGKSHVEHGRESLGRSVEASVQQADAVPESFVIRLPSIWDTIGLRSIGIELECQLFIDVEDEKIELRVPVDELARAFTNGLVEVRRLVLADLGDFQCSVYLGGEK
ncbi:MAG: hypothetical protein KDC95_03470 [Planctomycetes bacterium]|nr:hypothetical protein [Planctomycetota bacterium]